MGYGSQGRAQALNLRDSGIVPVIGLPSGSGSRKRALADGFKVKTPSAAIKDAGVIAVLIPDHKHKELFENLPSRKILSGKSLIFAHGLSVAFGLIEPPADCDFILVAPHGPGVLLREKYLNGEPFSTFVGSTDNASRKARAIGKAYAGRIGSPESSQFKSSFRDEAVGDIFGEQATLCGGLIGLLESGFETLVEKGLSPESAYLECVFQMDLLIDLVKKHGPAGMFNRISVTAAYGSLRKKDFLFDKQFRIRLNKLYKDIDSGEFSKSLIREYESGMRNFSRQMKTALESPLQKTHNSMAAKLKNRSRYSDRRKPGGE